MEARLSKLNNQVLENTKEESVEANNNQDSHTLENELKVRKDELLAAEESITRLTNENLMLARKLSELEEKNADESNVLERRFEQERKALKSHVNDLEKKLEGFRQELVALQNYLWELEGVRDMKEDQKHEKQAKLGESQGSVEQPASLRAAQDETEHLGQVEASLSQTAFAPQTGTRGMKRPREGDLLQMKAKLLAEMRAEIQAYTFEMHGYVWKASTQLVAGAVQAFDQAFGKTMPPLDPPPLFSIGQAADSAQQQQDHKNQPDD